MANRVLLLGSLFLLALLSPAAGAVKKAPPPAKKTLACYEGGLSMIPTYNIVPKSNAGFAACANATIAVSIPAMKLNVTVYAWKGVNVSAVGAKGCDATCCLNALKAVGEMALQQAKLKGLTITYTVPNFKCCINKDNCNWDPNFTLPKPPMGRRMTLESKEQRRALEALDLPNLFA